jgi:hypothetical protein
LTYWSKTKTATARNNFGEWPLANRFKSILLLHSPPRARKWLRTATAIPESWLQLSFDLVSPNQNITLGGIFLGVPGEKRVPIVLADCGRVNALVMDYTLGFHNGRTYQESRT